MNHKYVRKWERAGQSWVPVWQLNSPDLAGLHRCTPARAPAPAGESTASWNPLTYIICQYLWFDWMDSECTLQRYCMSVDIYLAWLDGGIQRTHHPYVAQSFSWSIESSRAQSYPPLGSAAASLPWWQRGRNSDEDQIHLKRSVCWQSWCHCTLFCAYDV